MVPSMEILGWVELVQSPASWVWRLLKTLDAGL
jgi:hypothetical protein